MRTQGIFYSGSGTVYDCEMDRCPKCNGAMRIAYTSKYKTVQSMSEVAMIAQRTKRCMNPGCDVSPKIWGSVEWGQIAPVSCTYGYDVIARIGWQRQTMQPPFAAIHTDLRQWLSISESQVRALYHYRYLPLLACHDWGAVVAWTVAINYPERLEKLAILNVSHPDMMVDFVLNNRAQRKKSWYVFFFQIPLYVEWILSKNNFEYLARLLTRSGRKNTFTEADILEYKKAWSQKGALTGMLNWYRAAVRRGLRYTFSRKKPPARRVHVPTMMLWGKRDVALSSEMARPSIELCDQGELTIYDKSTHWVQHDVSEEVNQKLIEFMR